MKSKFNLEEHCHILNKCYSHFFTESLCDKDLSSNIQESLDVTSIIIVSHGLEDDPIFNYGNSSALTLFEMNWDEFTSLPSRYSAEKMERLEREALLNEVREKGCSKNYSGIRISKGGKKFEIKNAKVWNLFDSNGDDYGQAACFSDWQYI